MAQAKKKKKEKKNIEQGKIHIQASFNNTIVTVTDNQGNAIAWSSTGMQDSRDPVKVLPLRQGSLQKMQSAKPWIMVLEA